MEKLARGKHLTLISANVRKHSSFCYFSFLNVFKNFFLHRMDLDQKTFFFVTDAPENKLGCLSLSSFTHLCVVSVMKKMMFEN
jgi:hypothetical protein